MSMKPPPRKPEDIPYLVGGALAALSIALVLQVSEKFIVEMGVLGALIVAGVYEVFPTQTRAVMFGLVSGFSLIAMSLK